MKDHCYYCDKALYKMYQERGMYRHIDDTEKHQNSDGIQICEKCLKRLMMRDTSFNCPSCATPIYHLRNDHFKEDEIMRKHLKGIEPQPDPYPNAFIKCVHCRSEVDKWR